MIETGTLREFTGNIICEPDSREVCIDEMIKSDPHEQVPDAERLRVFVGNRKEGFRLGQRSKRSSAFSMQSSIVIRSSIFIRSMNRINLQLYYT